MKRLSSCVFVVLLLLSIFPVFSADPGTLVCVGLYSEINNEYISYNIPGSSDWVVVKVGDVIPANAEIKIIADRDWIELRPSDKVTEVYEITGSTTGNVIRKVSEILKGKPRIVEFPNGTVAKPDPKYKDKLVVTEYLGRQIFMKSDGSARDIKYGDVLDMTGKVKIIAINNTIVLMNASGGTSKIIGPLNFTVEQVLSNKSLYKFLNVQ